MTSALLTPTAKPGADADPQGAAELVQALATDGAVRLPRLVADDVLRDMQAAFASRLQNQRWNNCDGYECTERLRHMVPDVLTLAQGFVDLALHPFIKAVLNAYLASSWSLSEAKGWKSLPTRTDFHGWHGDSWYDQTQITGRIPREVKLAFYLSDVKSGAFQYIKGSHGKKAPHHLRRDDVRQLPLERMEEFLGPAGSAVLFDTSGIHRQGIPILEPRQAIFYNFHDPSIPLQEEDVAYYRYHPLLLNAAFLEDMTPENMRILGFGDKTHFQPGFVRRRSQPLFQSSMTMAFHLQMALGEWSNRVLGKLGRMLRRLGRRNRP